jgi:hypothetical protein
MNQINPIATVNCDHNAARLHGRVSESTGLPDFQKTLGVTLECPSWWAEAAQQFAQTIKGWIENDKAEAAQRLTWLICN